MRKNLSFLALAALLCGLFSSHAFAQVGGVNPQLIMFRHNNGGGSGVSPSPVVAGNTLGTIKWNGLSAIGSTVTGASIRSVTDQVAPGILSGNMIFSTNNGNALNDRMIITKDGLVGIGTMDPLYNLHVVGNTHTSGRFFGRIHFDTDAPTDLPNTYIDEAYFERKSRAQLGLVANVTYPVGGILTMAPFGNSLDRQIFSGGNDGLWTRSQDAGGANSWAAWEKLLTSADINGNAGRVARFTGNPIGAASSTLGNSQLFDDGTDVGIGTTTPDAAYLLTVGGDTRMNGDLRVNNTAVNGNLSATGNAAVSGTLQVGADANFSTRVKIGAANYPSSSSYELAVGGGIFAEEVRVELQPWPDYVFEQGYDLKPLSEVARYIQTEKHLPGVTAAKEVAQNGLNLGEMQKMQMEKIEELYLHLIDMDSKMKAMQAENAALKAKVEQLEKR
jgi:hypothetical protein